MLYKIIRNVVYIDYSDVLIENTNPIPVAIPKDTMFYSQKLLFIITLFPSVIKKWNFLPDYSYHLLSKHISNYYKHSS